MVWYSAVIVTVWQASEKFAHMLEHSCFNVEAMRRTYTCTELPCPWNIPPSVDSIQRAKTADIDFTAPKSIIAPT